MRALTIILKIIFSIPYNIFFIFPIITIKFLRAYSKDSFKDIENKSLYVYSLLNETIGNTIKYSIHINCITWLIILLFQHNLILNISIFCNFFQFCAMCFC